MARPQVRRQVLGLVAESAEVDEPFDAVTLRRRTRVLRRRRLLLLEVVRTERVHEVDDLADSAKGVVQAVGIEEVALHDLERPGRLVRLLLDDPLDGAHLERRARHAAHVVAAAQQVRHEAPADVSAPSEHEHVGVRAPTVTVVRRDDHPGLRLGDRGVGPVGHRALHVAQTSMPSVASSPTIHSRICSNDRRRSRLTCICETPTASAMSDCDRFS